jgi:hypothetical protein
VRLRNRSGWIQRSLELRDARDVRWFVCSAEAGVVEDANRLPGGDALDGGFAPSSANGLGAYRQVVTTDEKEAAEPPEFGYLQSDEPITRRADDRLDRARLAEAIADQIVHSPRAQGFVIAIDGSWGSGKTSVMNMIQETVAERSDAVILSFNPWLFSGTEQLVVRFLQELSVQLGEQAAATDDQGLRERLGEVSERLGGYGEVLVPFGWVPVVGPWLARFGSLAKVFAGKRKQERVPSVLAQRQRVREALTKLDQRVAVFLDDLDRVEPEQIRDIVRLVKLVADFPNVTYLLAYDAETVAEAIGPDIKTGRAYLEKIVQVTHALPEISDWPLVVLLQTELDAALQPIEHGPFSRDDWVNVFHTGMRPFFGNMRDVRRYLNAVPVTLRVLGREVALVDALALETLRIFSPACYAQLPGLVSTLAGDEDVGWQSPREREEQEAIDRLIAAAAPTRRRSGKRSGVCSHGSAATSEARAWSGVGRSTAATVGSRTPRSSSSTCVAHCPKV